MNNTHVYRLNSMAMAREAVVGLQAAGIHRDRITLIARSDIEMERVPDDYRDASTDFAPAALKGAMSGGGAGLVAGLAAMAFPPLGITVAGVAAIAAVGALTGTWAGALVGSTLPDPIRRSFEQDIEAGRILLVVQREDDDPAGLEHINAVVMNAGGEAVEYNDTLLAAE